MGPADQTCVNTDLTQPRRVAVAVVVAAVALRFAVAGFGSNYDLASYRIVADLVLDGENVYAGTDRYNYGPIWFVVLGAFEWTARLFSTPDLFRLQIIALLSAVDVAVAVMVARRWGGTAAAVFLLSPVGIIISGFHNQFDNVAVALGLAAVLLLDGRSEESLGRRDMAGLGLLAVSLSVKHVLVVLPVWLLVRQRTWPRRVAVVAVPYGLFGLLFAPWVGAGRAGIVDNVIGYRSYANAPFLSLFTGDIPSGIPATVLFVAAMALAAWFTRALPLPETLLVHLVVLVVFSPALANQYLAIPLVALAVWRTPWSWMWTAVATFFLAVDSDGLEVTEMQGSLSRVLFDSAKQDPGRYQLVVALLALAALAAWRQSAFSGGPPEAPPAHSHGAGLGASPAPRQRV